MQRRVAEFTALLHDVGKIKIPKEIINKPGALTDEERAIINTHTIEGQRMLEKVGGLLGEVGYLVRSCHERWDGGGLPGRARGRADSARRPDRVRLRRLQRDDDRPRVPHRRCHADEAHRRAAPCAGTQFDPQVVEALIPAADAPRPAQILSAA